MITFLYTNSLGESLYINQGNILLERIDGLSVTPVETQGESSPYQDGNTYIDTLLNARDLNFVCQIRGNTQQDDRRKVIRVLNAKLGMGTLWINFNGIIRTLNVVVDGLPNMLDDFNNRRPTMQKFVFTLSAPNPYYEDALQEFVLAGFIGGLQFPFSFPISFGEVGSTISLDNDGDTIAPLCIQLSGPLTNPVLTNETTGEVITLQEDLPAGYMLEIDTDIGQKVVTIIDDLGNRSNGFQYLSADSVLFGLRVGTNVLSYTADFQPIKTAVTVMYKKRYIGL